MAACLLFGFLDAVAIRLQGLSVGGFGIPVQAIEALPYILTVFLLAGFIGKAVAPGDRTRFPLWLTVACGVVGMLVGSLLYWVLVGNNNADFDNHPATWDNATNGIDWWRHIPYRWRWRQRRSATATSAEANAKTRPENGLGWCAEW